MWTGLAIWSDPAPSRHLNVIGSVCQQIFTVLHSLRRPDLAFLTMPYSRNLSKSSTMSWSYNDHRSLDVLWRMASAERLSVDRMQRTHGPAMATAASNKYVFLLRFCAESHQKSFARNMSIMLKLDYIEAQSSEGQSFLRSERILLAIGLRFQHCRTQGLIGPVSFPSILDLTSTMNQLKQFYFASPQSSKCLLTAWEVARLHWGTETCEQSWLFSCAPML